MVALKFLKVNYEYTSTLFTCEKCISSMVRAHSSQGAFYIYLVETCYFQYSSPFLCVSVSYVLDLFSMLSEQRIKTMQGRLSPSLGILNSWADTQASALLEL